MPAHSKAWWYLNRLRLMQPAEIAHRVARQVQVAIEQLRPQRAPALDDPDLAHFGKAWCEELPRALPQTNAAVREAADRILDGRWVVFSLHDVALGFPPQWNRDPLSGTVAPMAFGKTLDYRNEALVGNIKYLWEPARHLELVTLAQAWRASGERRYLQGCATLLESWFDQCPYPRGVHWASSLELAVRLLNWAVAWHLMDGPGSPLFEEDKGRQLRRRWLDSVYLHQRFVAGHLSRYSSANNHLLGELMGLFVASLTWPCWPESQRWQRSSHAEFEAEALRQNSEDGVNREQGIYYHHEVADMMLWCGLFGRANGWEFSSAYWDRLEAMLGFVHALMDAGNHVPTIGDADDALMVRLDPRKDFDPYLSLLHTGAEIFARPQWRRSRESDPKTLWLLGPATRPAEDKARAVTRWTAPSDSVVAFPRGGYWILGSGFGSPQEVHLTADAGPLGYLSIAAHGHADALSLVLSLGGRPVLIDPGTYAYHTERKWRDYFRGTSAHNTLRVDGLDQSVIGGNFMWLDKANAVCLNCTRSAEGDDWLAEHDGYLRLGDPVLHRRRIQYMPRGGVIRITDVVKCSGRHALEWHWHFTPECRIELGVEGARVEVLGWSLTLRQLAAGAEVSLHKGQDDPPLGWISRRFDHKEPSPTLRLSRVVDGPGEFVTEMLLNQVPSTQQSTS